MLTAILAACALVGTPEGPAKGAERFWWVFIERTSVEAKLSEKESQEFMNGHLGNFMRLFNLNKLSLAGPMRDPNQTRRGIVMLTVDERADVNECFEPDPFFQQKIFCAHAVQMKADFGRILRNTGPDANSIEENRLVVFEWGKDQGNDHSEFIGPPRDRIRDGAKAGLAFHANTVSGDGVREIAIFRGKNDEAIEKWLQGDPLVASGALKATIYPQFLGKRFLQTTSRK